MTLPPTMPMGEAIFWLNFMLWDFRVLEYGDNYLPVKDYDALCQKK